MRHQIPLGFALYILLIATALLYYPGLRGPLLLDDFENLRSLADLSQGITTWRDVLTTSSSSQLGRPLTMLSFIANQVASAGEVWAYKYTNLMIHLLCGVLVFWLSGRLLLEHSLAPYRWAVALWVTALWLLTPLQVSTVLYVVQRMAQLATLFVLAGLLTYVIGRQNLEYRPKLGMGLILSCLFLWLPLAVLSKENGALLPLLMLVIEIFFFRFQASPRGKRLLVVLYSLFLLLPTLAIVVKIALDPGFILNGYSTRDFTFSERLLTESRILFTYFQGLLLPYGPALGLYHDDYVKSTGLLTPPTTLLAVVAWISIAVMAVLSLKARAESMKRLSYLFFGILFFLAAHVLESSIFSLELYFEHRNYLPSFGIYFSLGIALFLLVIKLKRQRFFLVLIALLPLAHAVASYPRVQTWTSWEQILFSTAQTHPMSARVHGDLAIYYNNRRDPEQAFVHLTETIRLNPQLETAAALFRVTIHCSNGLPITQVEYDHLGNSLTFSNPTSIKNAFNILRDLQTSSPCKTLDIDKFTDIIESWLTQPQAHEYPDTAWYIRIALGQMLSYNNRLSKAIYQMDQAIRLYPDRLEAGILKMQYQLALDDVQGAQQTLADLKRYNTQKRIDFNRMIGDFENHLNKLQSTSKN